MDEKGKREQKEQERENFKKTGGMVTRIEFYSCFMVLAALILSRGGLTNQNLGLRMSILEQSVRHQIDSSWRDVSRDIASIPEKVMQENESMFVSRNLFVTDINRKAKTFLLELEALPKEYWEDMEITFLVSCDSGEAVPVAAAFGKDRWLRAEVELPFCETVYVSAVLKNKGTEKIQNFGTVDVQMNYGLVPEFSGGWESYSLIPKKDWLLQKGQISVDVSAIDAKGLDLGEGIVEIQVDGNTVQTVQTEKEFLRMRQWKFQAELTEKFELKEGQTLSVIFKITDNDGVKYTYLVEESVVTENGLEERRPEEWNGNPLENGRLMIQ